MSAAVVMVPNSVLTDVAYAPAPVAAVSPSGLASATLTGAASARVPAARVACYSRLKRVRVNWPMANSCPSSSNGMHQESVVGGGRETHEEGAGRRRVVCQRSGALEKVNSEREL